MSRALSLATMLVALSPFACARAHLTETYGQSYSAFFALQAPSRPKVLGPVSGLDSQEASIISGSYRKSIAPKDSQAKEQPLLIVAPPSPQQGGYSGMTLPPSVPKS